MTRILALGGGPIRRADLPQRNKIPNGTPVPNDVPRIRKPRMGRAPSERRNIIGQLVFVRISNHQTDAGQRRDFFRRALRVAAGDQDLRLGVLPMDAADGGTRVLIGRCGDGAGIQDDDFGLGGSAGALQSPRQQLALDGGAIGLGRAASEVLDVISCHQTIIIGSLFGARPTRVNTQRDQ